MAKFTRVFQRLSSLRAGRHRPRFLKRINRFGVQIMERGISFRHQPSTV
jgi:hypothetical protein